MGTTCAALHIMFPADQAMLCAPQIEKAYARIGYKPVRKTGKDEITRNVIASGVAGGKFITVVDSANADLDRGELKELAVHISKALGAVVIVTSVYDSDNFEFLLFDAGRQFDAAVSDPDSHGSGLKMLAGKKRASKWAQHFLADESAAFYIEMRAGDATAAMQRMEAAQKKLIADIDAAARHESVFAEDRLARWCEAARIDARQALAAYEDWAQEPPQNALTLALRKNESAKHADASVDTATPTLRFYRSDDDCPYFRFYPAAWPALPGETHSFKWLVTSSGKGFDGLDLRADISGREGMEISKIRFHAYPFYNGQMTSMTPIAVFETGRPRIPAAGEWHVAAPAFAIPDLDAESRKQIVIIIGMDYTLAAGANVELQAALTPKFENASPCPLAPLRLVANAPDWTPPGASSATIWDRLVPARLCQPSILTQCALLRDNGNDARARLRKHIEGWLALFQPPAEASLVVRTQKHMSETSFRVAKANETFAFAHARADKLWAKLFQTEQNYHSIFLDMVMPGYLYPLAGVTLQAALKSQAAGSGEDATLQIAFWHIADPRAFALTGLESERASTEFSGLMREAQPVQAWIAHAAWIPEFDLYENYAQTLYEQASDIDWFRSGFNGKLAHMEWAEKRLRFVAPLMWLCDAMTAALDASALQSVAFVERTGDVTRIEKRPGVDMTDFEQALGPILPRAANVGSIV